MRVPHCTPGAPHSPRASRWPSAPGAGGPRGRLGARRRRRRRAWSLTVWCESVCGSCARSAWRPGGSRAGRARRRPRRRRARRPRRAARTAARLPERPGTQPLPRAGAPRRSGRRRRRRSQTPLVTLDPARRPRARRRRAPPPAMAAGGLAAAAAAARPRSAAPATPWARWSPGPATAARARWAWRPPAATRSRRAGPRGARCWGRAPVLTHTRRTLGATSAPGCARARRSFRTRMESSCTVELRQRTQAGVAVKARARAGCRSAPCAATPLPASLPGLRWHAALLR